MKFTKMHGCGNDYIYIYTGYEQVSDSSKSALALRLSDRHKGVGSDGLIFINPTDKADFEMEMYNSDGSKGAMCGNGIRCVGKYVYDHRLTEKTSLNILTGAGIKKLELKTEGDKATGATVNMGEPVLEPDKIPVAIEGHDGNKPVVAKEVIINGNRYDITCVSMGNPHCIIFCDDDIKKLDLTKVGPLVEHDQIFPDRVNTEFINVHDRGHISMRVWERGAGETLACGTGACASVAAAVLNGYTDRRVKVTLLGGELDIHWSEEDGCVYMTGPAETVFEGEIDC
ncbi:MAG: diaminopimelate epimerase [Lachnospiraceae bacterium]|nr:diaminopimelate epimerase [Lachnospiraceae bacterium]